MAKLLYLQSGGPTAVLNTSALGALREARRQGVPALAAADGLTGLLEKRLFDLSDISDAALDKLALLPGAAFGTSRQILPAFEQAPEMWTQLAANLKAADIGYVLLNGGNGSMETARQLHLLGERFGLPLRVVGIPKTIDNDLERTDFSPGFPSAAKYLAASLREVMLDMCSMGRNRIFIMETMGRHVGWLTAACALAAWDGGPKPVLLLPEVAYDEARLLQAVQQRLRDDGCCAIAVSEGLKDAEGQFVTLAHASAVYGHEQLGGTGAWLAGRLQAQLGLSAHVAQVDCLQRAARHLLSAVDYQAALSCGQEAARLALAGGSNVMISIRRQGEGWHYPAVALEGIANLERALPAAWIAADGQDVTADFHAYLQPLIQGEVADHYESGLPYAGNRDWPLLDWMSGINR